MGRFDEVNVFLRGAGTGVRGFAESSRDPTLVDDVTVDVVSEYDQPSTFLTNVEALSCPFDGISGGVDSLFVGEIPAKKSTFCGVDDDGSNPMLKSRFGGLPGDIKSLSNEDAEK